MTTAKTPRRSAMHRARAADDRAAKRQRETEVARMRGAERRAAVSIQRQAVAEQALAAQARETSEIKRQAERDVIAVRRASASAAPPWSVDKTKECHHCGDRFEARNANQRYCAPVCRATARAARVRARRAEDQKLAPVYVHDAVCTECGTHFEATTRRASLCSYACRLERRRRAYRERGGASAAAVAARRRGPTNGELDARLARVEKLLVALLAETRRK